MGDKPTANDESIRCLCCRKKLPNVQELKNGVQPIGGIAFHTQGHYGTRLFDPMDGSSLHVAICDECVGDGIERGDVIHFRDRGDRGGRIAEKGRLG